MPDDSDKPALDSLSNESPDPVPSPVDSPSAIRSAPTSLKGILKELGPGLIVAGAVVGSGELIATTATGAEAGFFFLWLILIGCTIKVFAQVEVARFAICTGKTSLEGMSEMPGPRIGPVNWALWFWLLTITVTTGQLGGIVGGVGQALSISVPLTDSGREYNQAVDKRAGLMVELHLEQKKAKLDPGVNPDILPGDTPRIAAIKSELRFYDGFQVANATPVPGEIARLQPPAHDHLIWAGIVAVITALLLVRGGYRFIQNFATVMVASFTLMTLLNVILLQMNPAYAISPAELLSGLSFHLPPRTENVFPIATALATFGIIGVAAGELVFYPYWCLEKGYAKFVGPNDGSEEWAARAKGWLKVLRWDAFGSMVVYTISTVAFYLLGAAILHRLGLAPKGTDMIRTLAVMYEPVFGPTAQWLFLFGAVAVLYSTFFVTNASKARMCADALRLFKWRPDTDESKRKWLRLFSAAFPLACFAVYVLFPHPKKLVLAGGVMQSILLPVMAAAALWFRYKRCDPRLMPGRKWDALLWISACGMLIAGLWMALTKLFPGLQAFG